MTRAKFIVWRGGAWEDFIGKPTSLKKAMERATAIAKNGSSVKVYKMTPHVTFKTNVSIEVVK